MLYNNQNKYTSAILVPNKEALLRWAKNKNINISDSKGQEAVLLLIESVVDQYRHGGIYGDLFPSRWLPAAISIIDEPFTQDNALINTTGKMVRAKIVEYHKDKIHYLYTPEAKSIVNTMNIETIKKILDVK